MNGAAGATAGLVLCAALLLADVHGLRSLILADGAAWQALALLLGAIPSAMAALAIGSCVAAPAGRSGEDTPGRALRLSAAPARQRNRLASPRPE